MISLQRDLDTGSIRLHTYPNPAQDYLNIQVASPLLNNAHTLEVFNLNGAAVYVPYHEDNDHLLRLNTSGLQSGMYVVRLFTGGQVVTARVVK